MTDRYEKIRDALAMGPTPGPWGFTELPRDMQRDGYRFSISRGGLGWWIAKVTHEANGGSGAANAAMIAACDPDTIRALLEERDALQAENERLHEQLRLALRDAAPAVQGEPVAYIRQEDFEFILADDKSEPYGTRQATVFSRNDCRAPVPLYTSPQPPSQDVEALLRQALEALELRCGTNAEERKELIPALRERLGAKA